MFKNHSIMHIKLHGLSCSSMRTFDWGETTHKLPNSLSLLI